VGPNNVGKSAIVAALQILCRNENSTYVMRHGEKRCSVMVTTSDGHSVTWQRKTSPSYLIDGQTFDRLRSGIPEELHAALRLPAIEEGADSNLDIHFGSQKSPIFLLDKPATLKAKFFASSSDASRLVAIQTRHRQKLQDAKREKQNLEAESSALNAELEVLQPVVDIDARLSAMEALHQELLAESGSLRLGGQVFARLRKDGAVVERFTAECDSFRAFAPPPALHETGRLSALLASLNEARRQEARSEARTKAAAKLNAPPVLADIAQLATLAARIDQAGQRLARVQEEHQSLQSLESPPQMEETEAGRALANRLRLAGRTFQQASSQHIALATLTEAPELGDEKGLGELIRRLERQRSEMTRYEQSGKTLDSLCQPETAADAAPLRELIAVLVSADDKAASAEKQCEQDALAVQEAERQLRTQAAGAKCEYCGSELNPDQLLARAMMGQGGCTDV
jgi:exonuclease SbcC